MAKERTTSIGSLTEAAKHLAERLSGLVGEAEQRRTNVAGAMHQLADVLREVAAAANSVVAESARLHFDDDLRRMKEHHGATEAIALVVGRGHVVAGLLKFEPTPDGYIAASMKTWRSNTNPVERSLGRYEPTDAEAHNRCVQRFLDTVDREMGAPPAIALVGG